MEMKLEGLGCPVCSKKILDEISQSEEVKNADFDIVSQELSLDFKNDVDMHAFRDKVEKIVHYYEPDVLVRLNVDEDETEESTEEQQGFRKAIKSNLSEIIGTAIFIFSVIAKQFDYFGTNEFIWLGVFVFAYVLVGGDILLKSAKNIRRGKIFDENFLMSIATIGAFFLGDYIEGVAVMLFYKVGEYLSDYAQDKSIRSINSLLKLKVPFANLITENGTKKIRSEEVRVGDKLLIKAGEQIPVDSTIITGSAFVDTKSITGEPIEKRFTEGDVVYGGYIVSDGPITIEATKIFQDSMVAKIIYLTKEASKNKAKTEKFITKFASYYTPAVVGIAVLISVIPVLFGMGAFAVWFKRGLIFLVISCPCALVLSVPLGYFAGIGAASKNGILVKGANYMETLTQVKTAVFDKTGTLTKGNFSVQDVIVKKSEKEELLAYFAAAEHYSNHPIARAIIEYTKQSIDEKDITDYKEYAGKGVSLVYKDKKIMAGNAAFTGLSEDESVYGYTVVYLKVDSLLAGYCILSDEIKPDTKQAIQDLRRLGVQKTVMLTGDNYAAANQIANTIGIDEVKADLLPDGKVAAYQQIETEGKVLFVGDGINDAPALALADVGISMGALGSDAAIEAADIVIMTDNLNELVKSIKLSNFTKKIIMQNIGFVLAFKVFVMFLGVLGVATMGEAVFADVGTALLATLNSMRILKYGAK